MLLWGDRDLQVLFHERDNVISRLSHYASVGSESGARLYPHQRCRIIELELLEVSIVPKHSANEPGPVIPHDQLKFYSKHHIPVSAWSSSSMWQVYEGNPALLTNPGSSETTSVEQPEGYVPSTTGEVNYNRSCQEGGESTAQQSSGSSRSIIHDNIQTSYSEAVMDLMCDILSRLVRHSEPSRLLFQDMR